MRNPWEKISLETYENHMRLDSVRQLQMLNTIMQAQLAAYPAEHVMIFGAAGGNGLEHIRRERHRTVCCVDINAEYLHAAAERYGEFADVLQFLHLDLTADAEKLPKTDLVIADLLIEYIGCPAFQKAVLRAAPESVSCVIQINTDAEQWVSDSPYLHAFDGLDRIHHQMDPRTLTAAMQAIGYAAKSQETHPLPNGKALVRLDYRREHPH